MVKFGGRDPVAHCCAHSDWTQVIGQKILDTGPIGHNRIGHRTNSTHYDWTQKHWTQNQLDTRIIWSGDWTLWTHADWTHNTEACAVGPIGNSKIGHRTDWTRQDWTPDRLDTVKLVTEPIGHRTCPRCICCMSCAMCIAHGYYSGTGHLQLLS